jgi:biopolymer transport protein ExbD
VKKLFGMRVGSAPVMMLTPFMDVLTVLLIYLIVTFSPEDAQIQVSSTVQLPESELMLKGVPGLKLEITDKNVLVNGKAVPQLNPLQAQDWATLQTHLQAMPVTEDKRVLVVSDRSTTFRILDNAFAAVVAAGYSDIYLLTEKKGDLQ